MPDIFHVFDVDDAEPLAGDLFRRRFHTDTFPSEPLHFVGMCRLPDHQWLVLGYVHYYLTDNGALCGGLVIDERNYRRLPKAYRQVLKSAGGMADLVLRKSFAKLPADTSAVWARIGNQQSEVVCRRVGFEKTDAEYIFVVWRDPSLSSERKQELVTRIASIGPF